MYHIHIHFEISLGTDSEHDTQLLQQIQADLESSVKSLQERYASPTASSRQTDIGFFEFALEEAGNMTKTSRFNTARNYHTAINRLHRYTDFSPLPFHAVTSHLIGRFEKHLQSQGCSLNTISCYMRSLRAIYNKAVASGIATQQFPFTHAFTKNEQTRKRALPCIMLRKLIGLDCTGHPALQLAKDIFLFSLYARGIAFIDIIHLRQTHIHEDYLVYHRRKTHQKITVKLEPPCLDILRKYAGISPNGYLFPILKSTSPAEKHQEYRYQLGIYNKRLKQLGKLLGIRHHLSSYVPRHTWASLAREQGIPLSIISESLGHTSEQTTRIYLKELEKQKLDQANQKLINWILFAPKRQNK